MSKNKIQCIADLPPGLRAPVQEMLDKQKAFLDTEREIAIKRTVALVQEIDYLVTLLMLIEEFEFSTSPRKRKGKDPRLQRAIRNMEKQLTYHGRTFGLEMLDGLRCKLESYGVRLDTDEFSSRLGLADPN